MSRCPYCKREIDGPRRRIFESSARSPLRNSAAAGYAVPPPPLSIERPVGLPSMESHVHVPANQALVGGCLCAPVVGLTVYTIGTFGKLSGGEAVWYGIIAGGITMFGVAAWQWFGKTSFYDSLLQTVETALDVDLDGDGEAGKPPVVQVEVTSEDGNRWQFADLPGKPEALQEFAKRVLMGQGFTDETGAMAGLTQREVKDLRAAFVEKGWAGWKHPTRKQMGIDVLHVGKAVLRAIGNSPTPPGVTGA